ncbi:D-ribose pyranase [Paenibacillus taichungensis]|uniref:D-ribose pyranase n=1 Tax=Paenibacillus TaxID=44249 RepID=UPI000C17AFB1|nr:MULTISPECIES: D-ribose pyranase [Paenibacillus]MEC0111294.1 D-ribose pyranase [Paenibacillus taichungensis]MEC0198853.1 D-ribose pyranase [Paenibacillus taichungensis]PIH58861.1 D-ribose pyranase [Paenibacillus sp. LK1]
MKKQGILNSHISKVLSDLGHTDTIVIADAGLPVPEGVPKIDLSLKLGTPSFQEVVELIADDMVIEKVILATEIKAGNPEAMQFITEKFGDEAIDVSISHEQFKVLTRNAKVVIRTGEATPYANCILQSGVIFG